MIFKGLADKAIERVAGTLDEPKAGWSSEVGWSSSDLDSIKVLWRKPETMELFGIPAALKPGQVPGDIADRFENSWIRLGYEGKWESQEAEDFVESLGDAVPDHPNEYVDLATWGAQDEEPV